MKVRESKFQNAVGGKKRLFLVEGDGLNCHEQSGIVLPMRFAFKGLVFEFLNVCDEKRSTDCDRL